mgnify:FL=1
MWNIWEVSKQVATNVQEISWGGYRDIFEIVDPVARKVQTKNAMMHFLKIYLKDEYVCFSATLKKFFLSTMK